MSLICQCCLQQIHKTNVTHLVSNIFDRWETNGVPIRKITRDEYPDDLKLTLYKCSNCGFGMFLPMTVGSSSFYADVTAGDYYLQDRWDFQITIKSLKHHKINSVLDFGCGRGSFLFLVHSHFPQIDCYGYDENPTLQNELHSKITFLNDLDSFQQKLDVVTMFQVIEHVENPADMVKLTAELLEPGGLFYVSVPDHSGPVRFFADSHTAVPPHHVTIWTPESLIALLKRFGFEILKKHTEPLPHYLIEWYLPEILIHAFGVKKNIYMSGLIRKYLANPIINFCKKFNIKSLPIKGHTYMVIARKRDETV